MPLTWTSTPHHHSLGVPHKYTWPPFTGEHHYEEVMPNSIRTSTIVKNNNGYYLKYLKYFDCEYLSTLEGREYCDYSGIWASRVPKYFCKNDVLSMTNSWKYLGIRSSRVLEYFCKKDMFKYARKSSKYSGIRPSRVLQYFCRKDILSMPKGCKYSSIWSNRVPEYFSKKGILSMPKFWVLKYLT